MIIDKVRLGLIGAGVILASFGAVSAQESATSEIILAASTADGTESASSSVTKKLTEPAYAKTAGATPPTAPRSALPTELNPSLIDSTADHSQFEILQREFSSGPEVTAACLTCHTDADDQMMHSIHFKWEFDNPLTGQLQGKRHVVNSFCGGVDSNEPRCSSCHTGYGWDDMNQSPPKISAVGSWDTTLPLPDLNPDLNSEKLTATAVDCLACHDRSGQYTKAATLAGHPPLAPLSPGLKTITGAKAWAVDLSLSAQSVGPPGRDNCGNCHFYGGGGDNVKHGDLSSALYDPDRSVDVHMATDGLNFTCATCHVESKHQWGGSRYNLTLDDPHSFDNRATGMAATTATCASCHSETPHEKLSIVGMKLNDHTDKIACQTCHIPSFARGGVPTKTLWDWSTAGEIMTADGKGLKQYEAVDLAGNKLMTYISKKGHFEYGEYVIPYYSWTNGIISNTMLDDIIDPTQVVEINRIEGSEGGVGTKIWPFKRMEGRQPYDTVHNQLVVSHVWGPTTDTALWTNYDWGKAIKAGMKSAGEEYSGEFDFVDTYMYWPTTHMVAPAEDALACSDCHAQDGRMQGITGVYIPGSNPFSIVNILGILMVLGTFGGVMIHALIRMIMTRRRGGSNGHA